MSSSRLFSNSVHRLTESDLLLLPVLLIHKPLCYHISACHCARLCQVTCHTITRKTTWGLPCSFSILQRLVGCHSLAHSQTPIHYGVGGRAKAAKSSVSHLLRARLLSSRHHAKIESHSNPLAPRLSPHHIPTLPCLFASPLRPR